MTLPIVAIVGRPNVGKSTLFNRLAGERLAIVDDTPGTTRDRLFAKTEWNGRLFHIIDTGGIDPTSSSSKTPLSISSADFIQEIRNQALVAIQEADVILFLVDALAGLTSSDQEVTEILRSHQRRIGSQSIPPIILVVNKADNADLRSIVYDFYSLGLGEPFAISAIHGTGTGDLLDEVVKVLPEQEEQDEDDSIKIAIVGKPNVGKSSLLNMITGEERSVVSPIAGTTRDAVDTLFTYEGKHITLIDTAGIRKRGKIDRGVEKYSVIRSMRAIERSDVALLMVDASDSMSAQDTHIAGFILDAWKSAIVLVNKWDTVEKDSYTMNDFRKRIQYSLNFMDYVPVLFISAKTGQRVSSVLPEALMVQEERMAKIKTSQLNRVLLHAQNRHSPTSKTGRILRIYYGTQVRSDPPTFMLFVNDTKLAHFSYLRYIENQLRKEYPFTGTPIRLVLKSRG